MKLLIGGRVQIQLINLCSSIKSLCISQSVTRNIVLDFQKFYD